MKSFLKQHWFLTTLAMLIALGLALGLAGYGPQLRPLVERFSPRWITAGVLFLMAFSLDSDHLAAAFRSPRPVVIACLVNFGLVPLLGWLFMRWQSTEDFRLGLMIAASVPCTTAAASVMTRHAKGNDAVSLLTTVATNLSCFVLTPLWLQWTTATEVEMDTGKLIVDLLVAVLAPTVAGQLLRQPARGHQFAEQHKGSIGVCAQVLIEVLVLTAALRAGTALNEMSTSDATAPVTTAGLAGVWISCMAIHLTALAAGWCLARRVGCARAEAAAVAFAGSQKTLPIGLYVADLFGSAFPFAMFPMLLYHTSQLFFDTWLASRMAAKASET
ncbi:MAG: hypothetical protein EXS05_06535 [Planctomycetaceae bacterium]|nr:hypothetical protein [Planctomycetaceae bacterium]